MSALLDPFRGPVFQALGWALVHFLWQGVIVAVVTRTALGALRGASSGTRYLVACTGLVLMAAAPVATALSVYRGGDADASAGFAGDARPFTLGAAPAGGSSSVVALSLPADAGRAGVPDGFSDGGGARGWMERAAEGVRPWLPLVVLAWMAGVALGAVRLAGAWLHLRRLRTRWTSEVAPAWTEMTERLVRQMGITRPVRLLESARMQVPAVMGALKPVILVPAGLLAGLSPQDVELILAHELAHVRRHDYVVNLLQSVLETVLFFHPAVWWLSGVVRDEREHCCDDAVVGATRQGKRYARALLAAEELRATGPGPMLAPALGGGSLYRRVRRIVAPAGDVPTGGGVGPVVTVLMMAGLLVGGTPLRANERDATGARALAADTTGELGRKWAEARARAASEGWVRGVWIGYAVSRRGLDVDGVRSNSDGEGSGTEEALSAVLARPGAGVVRMGGLPAASQVVLLFRLGGGGDAVPRVMKIRTPESPADLDDAPLVWLGTAPDGESLALLRDLYASTGPEVRREMAAAASLHGEGAGALAFVRTVLDTEPVPEVRAQAAYWLQYQRTHAAMALMERTACRDSSVKVREEAVTGIAKTASPEGWRVLASLASTAPSAATREEAGDWLHREGPGSENDRE